MSVRLHTRWHDKDRSRSLPELAATAAFHAWKIAADALLNLENEGFATASNAHRLQVLAEFLAFLLQSADRLMYEREAEEEARQTFVHAMALSLADSFAHNGNDLLGPGEHRTEFIALLNARAEEYAQTQFAQGEAGIDFLRVLGNYVADALAASPSAHAPANTLHWAAQHVMELEGPQCVKSLRKSMDGLLG